MWYYELRNFSLLDGLRCMDTLNKKIPISQTELQRIMALPKRRFMYGGQQYVGLYDAEEGRFYLLDDDGKLSGKTAIVQKATIPPPSPKAQNEAMYVNNINATAPPSPIKTRLLERFKDFINSKSNQGSSVNPNAEGPKIDEGKKKILFFLGVGGIIVIALIMSIIFLFQSDSSNVHEPSNNVVVPSGSVAYMPEAKNGIGTIKVIQMLKEHIPGEIIKLDNLGTAEISAENYNVINLTGNPLFQWSSVDAIVGKYASVYIPAGQYLQHGSVTDNYNPVNPWIVRRPGVTLKTIPVSNIESFPDGVVFGALANFSVVIQTVKPPSYVQGAELPSTTTGMTHEISLEQSIIIDTYGLKNVVICDLLDKNRNSLFLDYSIYGAIPKEELILYLQNLSENNALNYDDLAPAYIVVALTNEQADLLGDLSGNNVKVNIELTHTYDSSAGADPHFYEKSIILSDTIKEVFGDQRR